MSKLMRTRKSRSDMVIKVIIGTTLGLILIMGSMLLHQDNKLNQMQHDLQLKQQQDERHSDYTESLLNVREIQNNFNSMQDYSIMKDAKVSQSHIYNYQDDSILGMKKNWHIEGTANLVYDVDVRLADAIITTSEDMKTINIALPMPTLDKQSVHIEADSLLLTDSKANMLCNKNDGQKVMNFYRESFMERGIANLNDYYKDDARIDELKKVAKSEVMALINTLNLNNCNVTISFQ